MVLMKVVWLLLEVLHVQDLLTEQIKCQGELEVGGSCQVRIAAKTKSC